MKNKKLIFLTLALLLPVSVFVFLKMFGRNEFDVPVMHREGSVEVPGDCPFEYSVPYHVPDSLMASLDVNKSDSLYVFYFDPSLAAVLNRVTVAFDDAVQLVSPAAYPEGTDFNRVKECILLMAPEASIALMDHRNRIRGYYDGSDRDEADRLIVEIKIILKQY